MAVPASIITGAGLRSVYVYEIDTDGLPKAAAADINFNAGVRAQGARVLTMNVPAARRVSHAGDDRFEGYTVLPPLEGPTAEFKSGKKNFSLEALFLGQNVLTLGESKWHGMGTDKVGSEIQIALLAFGAAEDRDNDSANKGQAIWRSVLIPKCVLTSREGNMDDNAYEHTFDVTPYEVTKFPWGLAFVLATHGYTGSNFLDGIHSGKPRLMCATGDGATLIFPFPTGVTAVNADSINVFMAGAEVTTNITKAVGSLTFAEGHAPTDGAKVFVVLNTV